MPSLPNVPNALKVRITYSVEADAMAETIHHIAYSGGPPSVANALTMANSILAQCGTNFAALMGDSVSVTSVQVTDLSSASGAQAVSTGAATAGTRGTTLLAPGTCAVSSSSIIRRYRGGKPRSYFPFGISSDVQTSGLWTSAFVTAVNSAITAWRAAVLGLGAGCTLVQFINISYYSGFTVMTNPATGRARNVPKVRATPLTDSLSAGVCQQKIGSQRRRNRKA